jgi:hypothetical protein
MGYWENCHIVTIGTHWVRGKSVTLSQLNPTGQTQWAKVPFFKQFGVRVRQLQLRTRTIDFMVFSLS